MGFFSWKCPVCDKSIRSELAAWDSRFSKCVAVFKDPFSGGAIGLASGEYDGYGRVTSALGHVTQLAEMENVTVWHRDCWQSLVGPTELQEPSEPAEDQGYFVDNDEEWTGPELDPSVRARECLLVLIKALGGDHDCRMDHHGHCQEHGWSGDNKCLVKYALEIREALK